MPVIHFKGKTAVESYHRVVPHHTLEIDARLSELGEGKGKKRPSLDGNLIVEGDNLLALKSLLPTHAGRIKCIYIDPPYNTGNEGWVYNDNLTQPQFKEWIGQVVGKEGEDATRHDKWCCMMYPRLHLLKELLRDDGAIFVSIDDNEVHHLRMLMDEVFGERNLIGVVIWKGATDNNPTRVAREHEYMVCYARDIDVVPKVWKNHTDSGKGILLAEYQRLALMDFKPETIQTGLRAYIQQQREALEGITHYDRVDERGVFTGSRKVHNPKPGGYKYDVKHPNGRVCDPPVNGYRYPREAMDELLAAKRILFGDDEKQIIQIKEYLDEYEAKLSSVVTLDSRAGSNELTKIFGIQKAFPNPKPSILLKEVFDFVLEPGDMILDSFGGSGTTAHAVLDLNKDGGNRRFVLVQQPYDTKENEKEKFNICEKITAERVRRVSRGYSYQTQKGKTEKVAGLGGDFTYARVGPVLMSEYRDLGKKLPSYEQVARYVFFTETSQHLDPTQMNDATGFIGAWKGASYYSGKNK